MYVNVIAALSSLPQGRPLHVGGAAVKQPDVPSASAPPPALVPPPPAPVKRAPVDAAALLEAAQELDEESDEGIAAWRAVTASGDAGAMTEAWGVLLQTFHSNDRWQDLLAESDRALATPAHRAVGYAHLKRSIALQNLKRFDEALAAIDRAVALSEPTAHWQRACVLTFLGRNDDAVAAMRAELAQHPDSRASMLADSDFAPLRGHPAFEALKKGA